MRESTVNLRSVVVTMLGSLAMVFAGCQPGGWRSCPTDAEVKVRFATMKEPLEKWMQLASQDHDANRYPWVACFLRCSVENVGPPLPESRKLEYLALHRVLGDVRIRSDGKDLNVILWKRAEGIAALTGSRSKAITFIPEGDPERARYDRFAVQSLDGLESKGEEGEWVKTLGGGWYIVYLEIH